MVWVLNMVNIVAVNAILVLHVGKTGRRTVGRTPLGLHVPSRCDTTTDDQDKSELQLQHELQSQLCRLQQGLQGGC